jgi:surfactin synthase thioesterase subunit
VKKTINLFFLPFAGGSSYSYSNFSSLLLPHINCVPVELPGRGKRSKEELLTDAHIIVEDIYIQIKEIIHSGEEYGIFGHSMGALLGYLLLHKIKQNNLPFPIHFFASGRGGPSYLNEREIYYLLPKQEFREKLKELGGSPKEVLEHEVLMDYFEPILRADFQVVETYLHKEQEKLKVPFSVFLGDEDKISLEAAKCWQMETSSPIKIHQFQGDHFFILPHVKSICNIISAELDNDKAKAN